MKHRRVAILTVAVPPLVSGMWSWIDSVARALAPAFRVELLAISHDPDMQVLHAVPYDVTVIPAERVIEGRYDETWQKWRRWQRLQGELDRLGVSGRFDLLISDATPGVVGAARRLQARGNLAWVVLMGGDTFHETRHQWGRMVRHWLLARRLRAADGVMVDGMDLKAKLSARGVAESRICVAPHGVDTELFAPRAVQEQPRRIVCHGRLAPENGVDDWPAILQGLPGATCVHYGPGEQPVAKHEAMRFAGVVAQDELADALCSAAVCAYPLRRAAGTPRAVLEAMACGKAVVATRVGALEDVIIDGTNGVLTPPNDPAAFRHALAALLQDDPLRARLGRAARETILAAHSAARAGEVCRAWAERMLNARGR